MVWFETGLGRDLVVLSEGFKFMVRNLTEAALPAGFLKGFRVMFIIIYLSQRSISMIRNLY